MGKGEMGKGEMGLGDYNKFNVICFNVIRNQFTCIILYGSATYPNFEIMNL